MALVPGGKQKIRFVPGGEISRMNARFDNMQLHSTSGEVGSLDRRLTAQESSNAELKSIIERQGTELREAVKKLDIAEKKGKALEKVVKFMHGQMELLKDAASGLSAANVAIAVEAQLDGGRFLLVHGLMTVFPQFFPMDLRERWDVDKIRWNQFINAFTGFFNSHFTNGEQTRSFLTTTYANYRELVPDRGDPFEQVIWPSQLGDYDLLEPDVVQEPDEQWASDEFWITRLKYIAPSMIWAYNELKRTMLRDYDDAAVHMNLANTYRNLINNITGEDTPLPFPGRISRVDISGSCRNGSAYTFRTKHNWRDFVRPDEMEIEGTPSFVSLSRAMSVDRTSHTASTTVPRVEPHEAESSASGKVVAMDTDIGREDGESKRAALSTEAKRTSPKLVDQRHLESFEGLGAQFSNAGDNDTPVDNNGGPNEIDARLESYIKSMQDNIADVDKILMHMDFIRSNFLIVSKCLTVLLDRDLLDCAILGSSYARKLAQYRINKQNDYLKRISESKGNSDIFKHGLPPPSPPLEAFEHKDEHAKLDHVLNASDDLMMNTRYIVEQTVDDYVENEIRTHMTNDLRVLMEYFEQLSPLSPRIAQARLPGGSNV
ncbi:hypothetical protein SCHPADRAFT_896834 [Schizopora paradoxa]|uniref:Uncharacterized protein n=1 Tax=Schizopora paradoxa TaxID=27342 RepID=A0A0H2R5D2_9AGAM|nr:hypothetical protein SCHPADRAFT_896834 [Schizopora paradoxa]